MFTEGTEFKAVKTIDGNEFQNLKKELLKTFKEDDLKDGNDNIKWFLYNQYARDFATELIKKEQNDSRLIAFVDEATSYKMFADHVNIELIYGEYNATKKGLSLRTKIDNLELPIVDEKEVDDVIDSWKIKYATFTELKGKISKNDAFLGTIEVKYGDQLMNDLSVYNDRIVLSAIGQEFNIIDKIVGHKTNDEFEFDVLPKELKNVGELPFTAKVKIDKIYRIEKATLDKEIFKEIKLPNIKNEEEFKTFLINQKKLEKIEIMMSEFINQIAPKILHDNKIELNGVFVQSFFSKNRMEEQSKIIRDFGSFEKFSEVTKVSLQDFNTKLWEKSVTDALVKIFKFEVHNKFIFERDDVLFKMFEQSLQESHNRTDYDITKEENYKQRINESYLTLEIFLKIIEINNPVLFKKYFLGKEFPYI